MENIRTRCLMTEQAREQLLSRFLSYVAVCTTSSSDAAQKGIMPSTTQQLDLANILLTELQSMGITDACITEYGYVYAYLAPTPGFEHAPCVGFCAHLDTADEVSGANVQPRIISEYDGGVITLSDDIVLDPALDKELAQAAGLSVITTDGTTLLGADDKAGIAEIMTALYTLITTPSIQHGPIEILFSPDEETGHGMDKVPLAQIKSKQFYTLDGGNPPEIEIECFNAYRCDITCTGKSKHTGTARPDMINAVSMAADFISMLPRHEAPETTDGYQGFYAPMEIQGYMEQASITLFLRDFSASGMEERIRTVQCLADALKAKYQGSDVSVQVTKQYLNMKDVLDQHPLVTQLLVQAVSNAGLEPRFTPIRGGTDGSRLTEMGIPCPNIFTGGHNFHSRTEWACVQQMEQAAETVLQLICLWAQQSEI